MSATATLGLRSQEVVLLNHYGDTAGTNPATPYELRDVRTRTLVVNYYEPANQERTRSIEELIIGSISLYLEHMIVAEGERVVLKKSRTAMMSDLNQIVRDALKYYQMKGTKKFPGFSLRVDAGLRQSEHTEWRKTEFYERTADAERKQRLVGLMLQKERAGLRSLAAAEVRLYVADNLMELTSTAVKTVDLIRAEALLKELESFRKNDPLEPLTFDFSTSTVTLLASEDEFLLPNEKTTASPATMPFEERVLALLEQNSQRLDLLQGQIIDMRNERLKVRDDRVESLQREVEELRGMIYRMASGMPIASAEPGSAGSVSHLPSAVDISFAKASSELDLQAQWMLNEIVDIMARTPGLVLVISGHADRTGNPETNLRLSRQRAERVRDYIARSGLSKDRLVLNFFGDNRSGGANPEDRKVSIEFISSRQ
jgi:outer membrane protein OmpA-like peptidoglycan-associated protein